MGAQGGMDGECNLMKSVPTHAHISSFTSCAGPSDESHQTYGSLNVSRGLCLAAVVL